MDGLILGIDVGTSSVKVSVLDGHASRRSVLYAKSVPTRAKTDASHRNGHEQDVIRIVEAMRLCLGSSANLMKKVPGGGR